MAAQVVAQLYGYIEGPEGACVRPEDFTDESFRAVAVDGSRSGFLAGDEAQTRRIPGVAQRSCDEVSARDPQPRAEHGLELGGPAEDSSPLAAQNDASLGLAV